MDTVDGGNKILEFKGDTYILDNSRLMYSKDEDKRGIRKIPIP